MDETQNAVNIFNKLADLYQQKFMNVDLYNESLDFFCEQIKNDHATILELACGPGNLTKYILDKRPGLLVLGTDMAPNMLALARINNPSARFEVMDCREVSAIHQHFDGVVIGFVVPYLAMADTVKLIEDASLLLNDGGLLYLSAIEDEYGKSGYKTGSTGDSIMQYYYERAFLWELLTKSSFAVLKTVEVQYPGPGDSVVTDICIVAIKNPAA
jgi:2-polyprenyl-3-methyl-5-hydroxy-6-metoxy-1,4-benzoquinol methylase